MWFAYVSILGYNFFMKMNVMGGVLVNYWRIWMEGKYRWRKDQGCMRDRVLTYHHRLKNVKVGVNKEIFRSERKLLYKWDFCLNSKIIIGKMKKELKILGDKDVSIFKEDLYKGWPFGLIMCWEMWKLLMKWLGLTWDD